MNENYYGYFEKKYLEILHRDWLKLVEHFRRFTFNYDNKLYLDTNQRKLVKYINNFIETEKKPEAFKQFSVFLNKYKKRIPAVLIQKIYGKYNKRAIEIIDNHLPLSFRESNKELSTFPRRRRLPRKYKKAFVKENGQSSYFVFTLGLY